MKLHKRENSEGMQDVFLTDGDKCLSFVFGGNLDLYWMISNNNGIEEDKTFVITKENYGVYEAFEKLFIDIKERNVFEITEFPYYVETDEEKIEYLERKRLEKEEYIKYNISNYNELYNDAEKKITWYSDETAHEVANILTIKKNEDSFIISFDEQPYIRGYERESNMFGCLGIRFRNSGSTYHPFNYVFMRMYNKLQELDDINDINHQYHVEEYLFSKKLVK